MRNMVPARRRVLIVGMSGYGDHLRRPSLMAGCNLFRAKPLDLLELRVFLENHARLRQINTPETPGRGEWKGQELILTGS